MEAGPSLSLKRRYEEVDSGSLFSTPKDSDDDISSSDSADSCDSLNPPSSTPFTPTSILRQHKPSPGGKRVRFDVVTVYYFPRRQGFTSVPSQGGSSLGMARHHSSIRHYTLGEFAREQESSHRHTLRQHLRQEKLNARKMKLHNHRSAETSHLRYTLRLHVMSSARLLQTEPQHKLSKGRLASGDFRNSFNFIQVYFVFLTQKIIKHFNLHI